MKKLFLNSVISIVPSLAIVYAFSAIETLRSKYRPFESNPQQIVRENKKEQSLQYIDSVKQGYKPMIYPNLSRQLFRNSGFVPIGSIRKESYFCNEGYGLIKFRTDRFGLRNPDESWDNAINNDLVIFIGDSFTHGACIENDYPSIIRKSTSNTVLNLGMSGNDPYSFMATIKNLVSPLLNINKGAKRTVVLQIYPNDHIPIDSINRKEVYSSKAVATLQASSIKAKPEYIELASKIFAENYHVNSPEKLIENISENMRAINKSKDFKDGLLYQIGMAVPIRHRIKMIYKKLNFRSIPTLEAIKLLHTSCNADMSCKPYIVYIPSSSFWDPMELSSEYKNFVLSISNNLKIGFIDGENVIDKNSRSDYAPKGGHLSVEGYKKLANLISNTVNYIQ